MKSHGSQNIESTFTCTFSNIIKRTIAYLQPFSFFQIDDYTANTLFTDIMMKNTDIIPKKNKQKHKSAFYDRYY
jgi:hypothetical protein